MHLEELMRFRPLHDRVVVRRIEAEAKTKGGIIIPDTAKEKPQEGEVIAAGPGARDENGKVNSLDVQVGDRILFGKWSGTEVRLWRGSPNHEGVRHHGRHRTERGAEEGRLICPTHALSFIQLRRLSPWLPKTYAFQPTRVTRCCAG